MKRIVGKKAVSEQIADILYDESRFSLGVPEAVVFPESTEELREVVLEAADQGRSITTIGGQTGITGGSVPCEDCIALSCGSLNRILEVRDGGGSDALLLRCEPGVTLEQIANFLKEPWAGEAVKGSELLGEGAWFYPPDPTEMTAQLGGTVAANASGARSFRFGPTRRYIEALTVVFASGETATIRRGEQRFKDGVCTLVTDQGTSYAIPALSSESLSIKNASGYYNRKDMDLLDLFVGSEGTLGIFAEIEIRLLPRSAILSGLSFFGSRAGAFAFAGFLRKQQDVAAVEYFDRTALNYIREYKEEISLKVPEFSSSAEGAIYWEFLESDNAPFEERMEQWEEQLVACDSSFDDTWSGFEEDEQARLKTFRHAVPELVNHKVAQYKRLTPGVRKIGTDTAVSPEQFQGLFDTYCRLIDEADLQAVIFGHLGDYHLHFNLLPQDEDRLARARMVYARMMEEAIDRGGTVSAEHGIGKIKVDYLRKMYGEKTIAEMVRIRDVLDPGRMLNRGNLFGD
jgi:D-lactate dehydrogenase (cytochrome)